MNYEAYFLNANALQVSYTKAYNLLSALLNVTSTEEENTLIANCEQYRY